MEYFLDAASIELKVAALLAGALILNDHSEVIVPSYSPELIQVMRAALDEVMTRIPLDQATPSVKAAVAECILKAAATGQTSYDGLIAAASEQIQTILSMLV